MYICFFNTMVSRATLTPKYGNKLRKLDIMGCGIKRVYIKCVRKFWCSSSERKLNTQFPVYLETLEHSTNCLGIICTHLISAIAHAYNCWLCLLEILCSHQRQAVSFNTEIRNYKGATLCFFSSYTNWLVKN